MKKLLLTSLVAGLALLAGCNSNNIKFADERVKQICVSAWDTDGNGKLSYEEAAAVTSVDGRFRSTNITSFDEFQYFTGVTIIYREAFNNCLKLTSITLPEGIEEIGPGAFGGCAELEHIDIPDGVTYISPKGPFEGCDKLPVEGGIRYADNYAIGVVGNAQESYTLREGTLMVSNSVLYDIARKTGSITIPDIVTKVPESIFKYCSPLKTVDMPGVVTSIGKLAFDGCEHLTSVTLSESLESIGDYAFRECKSLTTITIPASVKSIGAWAFFDNTNIEKVYCHATTPPTLGWAAFMRTDRNPNIRGAAMPLFMNCKIYVPAASVAAYKSAAGWSDYAHQIVGF